ncbi:NADPH-dependent FMN reductase [Cellulomonas sp. Root137]|uniref:NADPH-dependent FMN reductase n=1 Tax=Cellulomonas sp. Root137 TaxID=1736459 RepID=UPI0006F27A5F|nr:NAD(P)H-dependent oxidoreductase [Cellulomonas sp. Root137]KQY43827.1 FMN reductase [Cellulomonas sp. Root137]KRD45334.1 FMN reductase [Cellulomonas sp. Root930]
MTHLTSSQHTGARVVVLSGNPRSGSRTTAAAVHVGEEVARLLGSVEPVETVELATFAAEILAESHPTADAALRTVADATVLVVATPVYKASYTGLLKAFLDLYGPGALSGVIAVPVVVSGNPAHALVGEVHLRPLLVELGAVVPTRALTLVEHQLADPQPVVDRWWQDGGAALTALVVGASATLEAARA